VTPTQFIQAPLQAKLSVARVFWLYGVAGSLVYGGLEFFIDPGNTFLMRIYSIGGFLYSAYVIVGTYRCSVNCSTEAMARFVRISSIISLILLPILTYFEFSSDLSQLEQLNL
jgi:hypothetical protein